MVAVERIQEFCELSSEAALTSQYDGKAGKEWPQAGTIDVKDLDVRYRPGLPLSLCGLTVHVEGRSRVEVVGRTGCEYICHKQFTFISNLMFMQFAIHFTFLLIYLVGKSTLVQSFVRLLEADKGQIVIDLVVSFSRESHLFFSFICL